MMYYILKRIVIFVPTIIVISLITFIISINAPGDPAERAMGISIVSDDQNVDYHKLMKDVKKVRTEMGLDLPVFYFSFSNLAYPDSINKINGKFRRKNLKRLIAEYGNWHQIESYYQSLLILESRISQLKNDTPYTNLLIKVQNKAAGLFECHDEQDIIKLLATINRLTAENKSLSLINTTNKTVKDKFEEVIIKAQYWKNLIPTIRFNGFNNQYHRWITQFFSGDFGKSYQYNRPISSILWERMKWTLLISIISVIITFIVAIPIGVGSAAKKGTSLDKLLTGFVLSLYSLPNFWIASLLIVFFCCGDYLCWFPPYGLGEIDPDSSFYSMVIDRGFHLILPVFCIVYPGFAFISRQMRGGMLNVLNQEYIKTARAKGLHESKVIWKHAFRNSLLPIITLFANVFPFAIGGSIVVEFIFNIPGMGLLGLDAVKNLDFPLVYTIMMFAAIFTLVGYLVADILYVIVDPRISYSSKADI